MNTSPHACFFLAHSCIAHSQWHEFLFFSAALFSSVNSDRTVIGHRSSTLPLKWPWRFPQCATAHSLLHLAHLRFAHEGLRSSISLCCQNSTLPGYEPNLILPVVVQHSMSIADGHWDLKILSSDKLHLLECLNNQGLQTARGDPGSVQRAAQGRRVHG